MQIVCSHQAACWEVIDVLKHNGITRGVSWHGGSPRDERIWAIMNAVLDPAVEAAIQHDFESIVGATIQE